MPHGFFNCVMQLKSYDGVQDMLPPNIAPWHTEYFKFKLKMFKTTAEAGRSLSDLPNSQPHPHILFPFTPETGYKTFM